jgi:hypothetical protein
MTPEQKKIDHLVKLTERLMEALASDVNALKKGRTRQLHIIDPEIQRLSAVYSREVKSLDPAAAKNIPADMKKQFRDINAKFRDLLQQHQRYVTRVRNASEGIIKAVAADVERKRTAMRTYAPPRPGYRPPPSAIVYNNVV